MCFSATASFIVGGSLTLLGAVTLKQVTGGKKRGAERPFAAIPLLFGIQQLVEGVLWLSIRNDIDQVRMAMTYLFTFFSHLLWPVYVPYAIALMERGRNIEPWRRNVMWGFRAAGIVVAALLLQLVATQPLMAVADEHIIYLTPFFYDWPMMVLYIAATCVVAFFSSHLLIRLFGLMVFLFFFVSYWFYTQAFFSVWCFFAAILSLIIYIHFRRVNSGGAVH
ncbi:MAG: hypothetical protein K9M17_03435 [Mariprofundaceae bacterium]|nr:hypothetical protein [Mariprofundaceae bacterium]